MTDPNTEPSVAAQAGRQVIMSGGQRDSRSEVKAGIKVDLQGIQGYTSAMTKLGQATATTAAATVKLANASKGVQAPGGGGGTLAAGTPKPPILADHFSSPPAAPSATGGPAVSHTGGFGGGSFGGLRGMANQGMGPTLIGASILTGLAGSMGAGVAQRSDRAAGYASSADKLNVLFQQMTGMSQMAIMNQRKPLQNYRIGGQEGANAMMQFASTTGYMATPQLAKSIESIRTLGGYSKSTAEILQDQQALLSPQVANKMYRELGGVNAYTTGGKMRDPLEMRQQLVKSLGLTNDSILKGAQGPGSVTRYRMTAAGIPVEMQDEILQQAKSQQAYSKKGGKGDYDPSNKAQRKMMGIEDNFATQQEESSRVAGQREENYIRRQIDNMAALEKSNQRLIKALGSLEDKMSGGIGAATSGRTWAGMGGRVLQAAGLGMMLMPGPGTAAGIAAMVGGSAIAAASGSGDPVDASGGGGAASTSRSSAANDANIAIPYGYGGKRKSLNEVKADPDFRKVDPRMQTRLLAMFRENPNVGIGDSFRESGEQERMFKSRYTKTDKKTNIFWQGSYWEHTSGAPAAPPGKSFHEVGLASDLVGDLGWMNANAHRFGLKHFANVNNEPWHVQLAELPNSRSEWDKSAGSVQAAGAAVVEAAMSTSMPSGDESHGTMNTARGSRMGLSGGSSARNRSRRRATTSGSSGGPSRSGAAIGGGQLTGAEVAALAYQAGFRGQALIDVVAISKRESKWNSGAYNPNSGTKDLSYGLMQINMLGSLGPDRLKKFGINSNEDLYDPATNMRAAYILSGGGTNFSPWGAYKGMSNTYNTDVAGAAKIVTDAGLNKGDPMPEGGMGRGGSSSFVSNTQNRITFAPNLNISGDSSTPDLRRVAREAVAILKEELATMELRSA